MFKMPCDETNHPPPQISLKQKNKNNCKAIPEYYDIYRTLSPSSFLQKSERIEEPRQTEGASH